MLQEYNRVMVAIDGSKQAENALEKAWRYAVDNKKGLVIAQVVPNFDNYNARSYNNADFSYYLAEEQTRLLKELEEKYKKKAQADGLTDLKIVAPIGNPKKLIAHELPVEEKIDALFMGATGLSNLEKVFVGSITRYVVLHAPCDVIIVR